MVLGSGGGSAVLHKRTAGSSLCVSHATWLPQDTAEGHLNLTEGSNSLTLQKVACISVPTSRGPALDLMAFSRARKAFYY